MAAYDRPMVCASKRACTVEKSRGYNQCHRKGATFDLMIDMTCHGTEEEK